MYSYSKYLEEYCISVIKLKQILLYVINNINMLYAKSMTNIYTCTNVTPYMFNRLTQKLNFHTSCIFSFIILTLFYSYPDFLYLSFSYRSIYFLGLHLSVPMVAFKTHLLIVLYSYHDNYLLLILSIINFNTFYVYFNVEKNICSARYVRCKRWLSLANQYLLWCKAHPWMFFCTSTLLVF